MREIIKNIDSIKANVKNLIGSNLKFIINRGRNKYIEVDGEIFATYPNVFTIRIDNADTEYMTFSYADIMTKNIKFVEKEKKIMS